MAANPKRSVLLVDDEELVREVTAMTLEDNDYYVITARSGGEALEIFKKQHRDIDAAVIDFSMPEMTGHELAVAMRAIKTGIGIVMISGLSVTGEVRDMQRDGGVVFVAKPFENIALIQALREVLREP